MAEAPFPTVLAVHAATLCALAALALGAARRAPLALALAALLFNAVPISPLLGMAAPIYLQDVAVPLVLGLALWRGTPRDLPLLALLAAAAFLWPAVGTLIGLLENARPGLGENAQFLYRRLAFVLYFAAGLAGVLRRGQLARFLDAALVIWVGMAVAGILQHLGLLEADLWSAIETGPRGEEVTAIRPAARGFMGLNRGAVGVWGSAAATYAFAMLTVLPRRATLRLLGYGAAAALSTAAILLSGSRTGAVAVAAGLAYAGARSMGAGQLGRTLRILVPVAAIAAAVSVASTDGALRTVWARFSPAASSYDTGQQRAEVQRATISFVLSDLRALSIGMGHSTAEFRQRVGDRFDLPHSHSEYVEVLWEAGLIGLVLYGAFVLALFRRLRPAPASPVVLSAARPILVAGAVTGIAVGHLFITSARLAPFGLLMAFVYGAFVHEEREARGGAALPAERLAPWPARWSSTC